MSVAPSKFRLGEHTLADLDALAAGIGGVRTAALRDAIHYWRQAVERAGQANAEELSRDDWTRLAHLNRPDDPEIDELLGRERYAPDWSVRLAQELVGMWEGKPLLPVHAAEKKACESLARRVAKLGPVRGYALYLCLSHFWGPALGAPGDGEWWRPEGWLTPTAKGKE